MKRLVSVIAIAIVALASAASAQTPDPIFKQKSGTPRTGEVIVGNDLSSTGQADYGVYTQFQSSTRAAKLTAQAGTYWKADEQGTLAFATVTVTDNAPGLVSMSYIKVRNTPSGPVSDPPVAITGKTVTLQYNCDTGYVILAVHTVPVGGVGPQGPAGPTGATGAPGINGRDGRDGKDGKDGAPAPTIHIRNYDIGYPFKVSAYATFNGRPYKMMYSENIPGLGPTAVLVDVQTGNFQYVTNFHAGMPFTKVQWVPGTYSFDFEVAEGLTWGIEWDFSLPWWQRMAWFTNPPQ